MTFEEFERRALADWSRIPDEYKRGIDGLQIMDDVVTHPSLSGVYTLGECVTEVYPSDFGGPDTIRSSVVLHHGSFIELARDHDDFDWEHEIWETLTHELQHHLESLASDDALEDLDYAADENFKRWEGERFDPFFYRSGVPEGEGRYRIDDELFIELPMTHGVVSFVWEEETVRVDVPDCADADIAYVTILDESDEVALPVQLVMTKTVSGWRALRALFRPRPPIIVEAEAVLL